MSPAPETRPAPATKKVVTPAAAKTRVVAAIPDYINAIKKQEAELLGKIDANPIYQIIIGSNLPKEERIAKVVAYETAGVEDGTATIEDLDARVAARIEFNAFVQMIRKQLGLQQANEITNKAYADFQRIVNDTASTVQVVEDKLTPLNKLAELYAVYGADGNIIEKINQARAQQAARLKHLEVWQKEHAKRLVDLNAEIAALDGRIATKAALLAEKSTGIQAWFTGGTRLQLENEIQGLQAERDEYAAQLELTTKETPDEALKAQQGEIEPVDENILELQDIGGPAFKEAVRDLSAHTEEALARISANFDEAVTGLTNSRESFITMDRHCSDATFALSVLEVATKQSEEICRAAAEKLITSSKEAGEGAIADLERMERENRSEQILGFTASLTSFLKNTSLAVGSLRSGQTVIKNVLRMNSMALEQANTHKVTGIANTANAVTITIGSIIDVCNRAASRALADGLTRIRDLAQEGNARLMGGTYEGLEAQNQQLQEFVESLADLKSRTMEITANSVDLLKQQLELVGKMRDESRQLAEATTDAERSDFAARSGSGVETKKPEDTAASKPGFGLRMGH